MDASDGEVYRKYSDDLVRFATGLVGPFDAADVVAEAVVRCMSARRWRTVEKKKRYLYRAVLNEAKKWQRTTTRRHSRERRSASPERVDFPELRPEILAGLAELSLQQRAVIFLTYWEDLTPRTVATVLGVGEGSVKRQLARGRRRLKEVLESND